MEKLPKELSSPLAYPKKLEAEYHINEGYKESRARKSWVCCTWALTWFIPSCCLSICGMKRKEVQMAWREKLALNFLIIFLSLFMIFYIAVFGRLLCPKQTNLSVREIRDDHASYLSAYVYTRGKIYDISDFARVHQKGIQESFILNRTAGKDVTSLFPFLPSDCMGDQDLEAEKLDKSFFVNNNLNATKVFGTYLDPHENPALALALMDKLYKVGNVVWDLAYMKTLEQQASMILKVYKNEVFDVTPLKDAQEKLLNVFLPGLGASLSWLQGKIDITKVIDSIKDPADRKQTLRCLRGILKVGEVDTRNSLQCQISNHILLVSTGILVLVILFKFLTSLQLESKPMPEDCDRFVICQVPCYTEDIESLKRTINSLASLKYDDKRKLLFIICDGMITGSGNDKSTPELVLDILGVDPQSHPEPLDYVALGDGKKQHNRAQVFSGLYEMTGHVVPYIVIVKVGTEMETSRAGNRGKRDSQILLMRFLNRAHYDKPMNPVELEIYQHMKHIVGVDPTFYEYILMVDADTVVMPDALNRMVSVCCRDSSIMGLCGETKIANEKETIITMIQVYEYFISHHMAKSFESLFGAVTCLPGCFCMYRIKTPQEDIPLLINNAVVSDYSQNRVDTLHVKNLLSLGEDRYLTTLMLKHFPKFRMVFTPDAQCETHVPDRWSVLVSQRRRWINSTVHNLAELMFLDQLCGFCCFSMRFIVILDLFGTLVMPSTLLYLAYIIYMITLSESIFPVVSLFLLVAVYMLQAFIFIIKRQYQHIGWLIIYLMALPFFSFYLPLYAFWHFDDFSWGNTRKVTGEKNHSQPTPESEQFDPNTIPHQTWSEYEAQLLSDQRSRTSDDSKMSSVPEASLSVSSLRSSPSDFYLNKKQSKASKMSGGPEDGHRFSMAPIPHGATRARSVSSLSSLTVTPTNTQLFPITTLPQDMALLQTYTPGPLPQNQRPLTLFPQTSSVPLSQPPRPLSTLRPPLLHTRSAGMLRQQHCMSMLLPRTPALSFPGSSQDFPTDAEIRSEVYRILSGADLTKITKKKIREELSAFFKVNLSHRKEFINVVVHQYLTSLQ